jgi:hypothetical protein
MDHRGPHHHDEAVSSRRGRRWSIVILSCLLAAGLAGCGEDSNESTSNAEPAAETLMTGLPMSLDVLVYNIEYGGDASTDEVIKSLDADVVGVLESYNRLPEIAENTGYPYYDVGLQILSKYPILEPSGADGLYAFIEVQPGFVVPFFNTHLDYVAFGPKLLAEGQSEEAVLASEDEVRTSSMDILLPDLERLSSQGYPTFLTGDFNEPSSLDGSIPWPVSEELIDAGFRDSYREINPDAEAVPGITWGNLDGAEHIAPARIDYVYSGGPVVTENSLLIGEPGGPDVDEAFPKWTSDHRAVLSSFELTPVALPTTVALNSRMLTEGDTLTVYYNSVGQPPASVAVRPADDETSSADAVVEEEVDEESGTLTIDTGTLAPGGYDIALEGADGDELATNEFWVRSTDASVTLTTDKTSYAVGEPIKVTWDDGPANRWDWVAVYRADAADPKKDDYLVWGYTGGHNSGALPPSVSGEMTFNGDSQGGPWPLPPGDYVVHYLLTDQYNSAGQTPITVK